MAKALKDLIRSYRRMAAFQPELLSEAASDINSEIASNFAAGRGPYGEVWEALKPATLAKGRFPPPLTDSGKLLMSALWSKNLSRQGKKSPAYGAYHMASRPWTITDDAGLPSSWQQLIQEHFSKLLQEARK